jgi:hypothetical protein
MQAIRNHSTRCRCECAASMMNWVINRAVITPIPRSSILKTLLLYKFYLHNKLQTTWHHHNIESPFNEYYWHYTWTWPLRWKYSSAFVPPNFWRRLLFLGFRVWETGPRWPCFFCDDGASVYA